MSQTVLACEDLLLIDSMFNRLNKHEQIYYLCLSATLLANSTFAKDTVAVYDLQGAIPENGAADSSPLALLGNPKRAITHYDIIESLNYAIADDEVKAIAIDVDDASMSLAQIQEVRRLLLKAKAKKKDLWLYTEYYNTTTALLGSACNHFTLMPTSSCNLSGLYSESMYFKNLFDKIGVKMEVVHIGDFKSAGEQFYRNAPSVPAQKQSDILFDSLFEQIQNQIATGRGVKKEVIKAMIDKGNVTAEDLLKAKLIDHLDYRTDLIAKMKKQYAGAKFDRSYELPNTAPPEIKGMMDLFKLMANKGDKRDLTKPYIAIIPLEGAISDTSIAPVRKEILKVTKDANCKGLVLRVNSPGGSALSSDVLWEATDEFKKTKRPFIVSMGAVAASGGYYVSAAADTIFAENGTITGSIGVVGMKPVIGGALDKLGISVHSTKRGAHADIYNTSRGYTDVERKLIRDSMLTVYSTFKKRITDGRGDRIIGDLEKLAGGRVYSGKDALKIGLIDEIGGLNEAINACADKAELDEVYTYMFPEPKNPMENLFSPPKRSNDEEFLQTTRISSANKLSTMLFKQDVFNMLGEQKKQQLNLMLQHLESSQKNSIQLIAPAGLNIQTK